MIKDIAVSNTSATVPRTSGAGNAPPEEHFIRDDNSLAVHVDAYLDHMRVLNRTPKAVRYQWNALKILHALDA